MSLKLFLLIIIGFILSTIVGTLSHEIGHIVVAESLGYKARLNYGSMSYSKGAKGEELAKLHDLYADEIAAGESFPGKNRYDQLKAELSNHDFWVTMGGPIQTMLTGSIGIALLIFFRKNRHDKELNFREWIFVFLALFWLREPFNLAIASFSKFFYAKELFAGDEFHIASYLELPYWSIAIFLGLLGLLICLIVIFYMLPKRYWIGFNLAGLIGGVLGYYVWFEILGPFLFNS